MPFDDVKHQSAALDRIRRALASGRVPHAYLFTGRPGVGRAMLADRLAQFLLCGGRGGAAAQEEPGELFAEGAPQPSPDVDGGPAPLEACGRCEDCTLFAAGTHPDFHPIYRALNRHHPDKKVQKRKALEISVDVIRHFLLNVVSLRPARGRAKVFVVSEAERLSPGAQNAMLKTLEEPPGHSCLILIATSADELLATTRSRCHHVPFCSLPTDFVVQELLAGGAVAPAAARFVAALAQGSLGEALRLSRAGVFEKVGALVASLRDVVENPLAASQQWQEMAKSIAAGESAAQSDDESADDGAKAGPAARKKSPPAARRPVEAVAEDDNDEAEDDEAETVEAGPDLRTVRQGQRLLLGVVGVLLGDALRVAVGVEPVALADARQAASLISTGRPGGAVPSRKIGSAIAAVSAAERQLELNANAALVFDALAIALARALGARAA